jgi:hypothetical protein
MRNSESYYDALAICVHLDPILDSVAPSEIYIFAYLACLLSIYRNHSVTSWGYRLGSVEYGYPFSPDLAQSIEDLVKAGYLKQGVEDKFLRVTPSGEKEFEWLQKLGNNAKRDEYIDGACYSALSLPLGVIRDAIDESRDVQAARKLSSARHIPSATGMQDIHDQFDVLSKSIGVEIEDLMIPAVVWLQFMSSIDSPSQQ